LLICRLPLSHLRLAHVGKETRIGGAARGKGVAGLAQTELAVHREPDHIGIVVVLPVILPPANRAKAKRAGGLERLVSTARAAKTVLCGHHIGLTMTRKQQITSPALDKGEHLFAYRPLLNI